MNEQAEAAVLAERERCAKILEACGRQLDGEAHSAILAATRLIRSHAPATDALEQSHDVIESHLGDGTGAPAGKAIQLSLTYYSNSYKVTACNNTAVYKPGDWLSPAAVTQICAVPGWQVIIVDNDIQSQVLGFVKSLIPTITL